VTGQQGEKFPSKKILLSGIFRVDTKSPQNLNDVDSLLNFRAEEALAPLFQPDTVASAEYFEIYQRKVGLEPEKKLRLAVLRDAIGCFKIISSQETNGGRNGFKKRRNGLTRRRASGYSLLRISCEPLGA